jgi:hypothetical protein
MKNPATLLIITVYSVIAVGCNLLSPDGEVPPSDNPLAEIDRDSIKSTDFAKVPLGEWHEIVDKYNASQAKLEIMEANAESRLAATRALARMECLKDAANKRDSEIDIVLKDVSAVVESSRVRLLKYISPAALVNGECEATLSSNKKYKYILKNVCLNIVNKKVNNDGEISGLIGAVSSEALIKGIVKINCDVGKAHIALLAKKCDTALGTSLGSLSNEEQK